MEKVNLAAFLIECKGLRQHIILLNCEVMLPASYAGATAVDRRPRLVRRVRCSSRTPAAAESPLSP